MELNTLGAALQWGCALEDHLIMLCEKAIEPGSNSEKRSSISSILSRSKRRKANLQRYYSQNVYSDMDTGIFEPIGKLEMDDRLQTDIPVEDMDIEIGRFYKNLASSLNSQRRSLIREFKKMAAECGLKENIDPP